MPFPPVTTYGLFLAGGVLCTWFFARMRARAAGLDPSHIDLATPLILIGGALGARLLALAEAGFVAHGRLRLLGFILAGLAVLAVYSRIAKCSFPGMADLYALPALAGLAILRFGCLSAGCCWGKACELPFAFSFPPGTPAHHHQVATGMIEAHRPASLPVHPTQLYEILLLCLLYLVVRHSLRGGSRMGTATLRVLGGYAVLRFGLEFLRGDSGTVWAGLTFTQLLCLGIGAGCVGWLVGRPGGTRPGWRMPDGG